eukprot:9071198-Pyramimonas_sp.AAC.1
METFVPEQSVMDKKFEASVRQTIRLEQLVRVPVYDGSVGVLARSVGRVRSKRQTCLGEACPHMVTEL